MFLLIFFNQLVDYLSNLQWTYNTIGFLCNLKKFDYKMLFFIVIRITALTIVIFLALFVVWYWDKEFIITRVFIS